MSETTSVIPLRSAARQHSDSVELAKCRAELERVKQQVAERDLIIKELREENKFLRLPKVAQRRHRDQQQKENRRRTQQINSLKHDLIKGKDTSFYVSNTLTEADLKRGSISAGSSWASSPGSTNASTPADVTEPSKKMKKFQILKEAPSRQTIEWQEGYLTTDAHYFRRSQRQLVALQELINDHYESISSEDSIPLETPRFRPAASSIANKSDQYPVTEPSDETKMEEDLSDASFIKRHAKLEVRERNLVNSDKRQQMEIQRRQNRERGERGHKQKQKVDQLYSGKTLIKIESVNDDEIPLTIFGAQVPSLLATEFKLPWLTTTEDLRREKSQRRSDTRRSTTSVTVTRTNA